jgi:hypothetical protein
VHLSAKNVDETMTQLSIFEKHGQAESAVRGFLIGTEIQISATC